MYPKLIKDLTSTRKKDSIIKEHFDALSIKEKRDSGSLLEYV